MPASASRIQVGSGERRLLLLLSALVAFGPLSIDMYLPSLPAIAADLGASDAQVQRSISGFLVGFCVGMLFYGPLSDRFGRRPVLLAGIALYLFSSLACALADSAGQLVLLRVLQALGGGAASVLARAMVRDLYPLGEAARMLALMHMVTMLAPLAAPLLGGYLMLWAGWRALFVVLALFAGLCLLAVWRVAESHPPERRGGSLAQAFLAYGRLLGDGRALGYVLCMGLAFAGMFAYISAAPFVFIEHFGVRAERFGWFFGLNILGVMLATWCSARLVRRQGPRPLLRAGSLLACVSGLFLLGYAALGERGGLWALMPGVAVLRQRHRPARRQLHRQPAGVVSRSGRGGFGGGGIRAVRPRLPGQSGGRLAGVARRAADGAGDGRLRRRQPARAGLGPVRRKPLISFCIPACSLCFFRYSFALSKPAIQARTLCQRQDPH